MPPLNRQLHHITPTNTHGMQYWIVRPRPVAASDIAWSHADPAVTFDLVTFMLSHTVLSLRAHNER